MASARPNRVSERMDTTGLLTMDLRHKRAQPNPRPLQLQHALAFPQANAYRRVRRAAVPPRLRATPRR